MMPNKTFFFTFKNNDEIIDYMLNTYMPSELDYMFNNDPGIGNNMVVYYSQKNKHAKKSNGCYAKFNINHTLSDKHKLFLNALGDANILKKPLKDNSRLYAICNKNIMPKSYLYYDFFVEEPVFRIAVLRLATEYIHSALGFNISGLCFEIKDKAKNYAPYVA